MQHNYFFAWPRMTKIGQNDVLFAAPRSKKKHWVTYKDSFKGYSVILHYILKTIFIGYPAFFFRPSIDLIKTMSMFF